MLFSHNAREVVLLIAVVIVAIAATRIVRAVARSQGIVAVPRADRWNRKPTALLGGAGIYAAFVGAMLVLRPSIPGLWPLVCGATVLFFTGLIDDLMPLKPHTKLVMQVAAALVLPLAGVVLPWTPFAILNDAITLVWMVGITNAVNLLDNMDGLAGGVATIACISMAASLLVNGRGAAAMVPLVLACAIAGFLVFNFSPASIFMGDCGSLFLGFMLGGAALLNNWGRSRELITVLMMPVLIMVVPIVDTSLVTITRMLRGKPVSQGGRDHLSHRLVALGLSERRAVVLLYSLTALSGGVACVLDYLHAQVLYLVVPCFALVILFFALHLGMISSYDDDKTAQANVFTFLIEFSYKRRILEVLFDLILMSLAYFGAFLLRFEGVIAGQQMEIFKRFIPVVLGVEVLAFLIGGIYRGLWRYAGIEDGVVIVKSVLLATITTAVVIVVAHPSPRLSISVLILNSILLLLLAGGSRAALRLCGAWLRSQRATRQAASVVIYGAGARGDLLVRQMLCQGTCLPVGFLDDDLGKAGRRLHGIPIYNPNDLFKVTRKHVVTEILVSSVSIPEERARALGIAARWT